MHPIPHPTPPQGRCCVRKSTPRLVPLTGYPIGSLGRGLVGSSLRCFSVPVTLSFRTRETCGFRVRVKKCTVAVTRSFAPQAPSSSISKVPRCGVMQMCPPAMCTTTTGRFQPVTQKQRQTPPSRHESTPRSAQMDCKALCFTYRTTTASSAYKDA